MIAVPSTYNEGQYRVDVVRFGGFKRHEEPCISQMSESRCSNVLSYVILHLIKKNSLFPQCRLTLPSRSSCYNNKKPQMKQKSQQHFSPCLIPPKKKLLVSVKWQTAANLCCIALKKCVLDAFWAPIGWLHIQRVGYNHDDGKKKQKKQKRIPLGICVRCCDLSFGCSQFV